MNHTTIKLSDFPKSKSLASLTKICLNLKILEERDNRFFKPFRENFKGLSISSRKTPSFSFNLFFEIYPSPFFIIIVEWRVSLHEIFSINFSRDSWCSKVCYSSLLLHIWLLPLSEDLINAKVSLWKGSETFTKWLISSTQKSSFDNNLFYCFASKHLLLHKIKISQWVLCIFEQSCSWERIFYWMFPELEESEIWIREYFQYKFAS